MGMVEQTVIRASWALLTLAVVVSPAQAQIASGGDSILFRSDAAGVRIEPQYKPEPLRWGPLLADVRVTTRAVVDSNVFRTAQNREDDTYVEVAPSIRVLGSFGPHNATFSARANVKRFSRLAKENSETVEIASTGRIDLGAGSSVAWRTQFARETESRGEGGSNVFAAGPARLQILQSGLSASADFGRLNIAVAGNVVERTYFPLGLLAGGTLDQSFRDTRLISVAPRARFGISPSAAIFVAGSAVRTTSLDRTLVASRDSSGFTLLTGFRTEGDGLFIGEVGIGWRDQAYRNPAFRNFSSFTYDATVDWYPTRLISARVQLGQDIVNSGLPTVPGILRRSAALRIYYDPLRNLRFNLALDRDRDEFREIDASTKTVTVTLTGRSQIGRHLIGSAFGQIQSKTTSDSKRLAGYHSVAVGVALTGVF